MMQQSTFIYIYYQTRVLPESQYGIYDSIPNGIQFNRSVWVKVIW